ncbi:Pyridoxal 5'-phosphate synthase subunit snz1, partial [Coemansia linderi]
MRTDAKLRSTLEGDVSIYQPLLKDVIDKGRLPVPIFGAGGIHTPTDVAMMMNAGCDGVFVDNNVFLTIDPEAHLKAIIQVVKSPND